MFVNVEFESQQAVLRGRLYRPEGNGPFPVVVMAHGTSATITMTTDHYAEAFREAGLAVLLYDHRNFGASGGEPRQEINPWVQARRLLRRHDPPAICTQHQSRRRGHLG